MIGIEIAGIRVALQIEDELLSARVLSRYVAFAAPAAGAAYVVRAVVRPDAGMPPRADRVWRVDTESSGDRLTYRSLHDEGWMDWRRAAGQIELRPGADIENYLRVLCAYHSARSGGVMLHASGVALGERASVFFGQSGSGKSTVAHLSLDAGLTVLGDDIVIIGRRDGRFVAHGVPFRGSNPRSPQAAVSAPLAGLFKLVKARNHSVVPMTHPATVARLVQCVPFVMNDPLVSTQVISTCRDLVLQIPAGELRFRMDAGFWSVINAFTATISHPA
ncbi:MAG: hypothetical protein HZB53_13780 [Chloroflexi bacterium]|nr:hypothetical protein [Chloroflexota bacterium]